ncbi:MAG TPA: ABC transporter permease [Anaerolineales bacterium]
MMRLAWRNLVHSKARLSISVGGVGLAMLLILALDAVFTGAERTATAYIDRSRADILVSQAGVRNMHMASSSLPAGLEDELEAVPGVASATPILYLTNVIVAGGERSLAYVIGLPPAAEAGGPWQVADGSADIGPGEAVIDEGVAEVSGVGVGDRVEILGRQFRLVGVSRGTATFVNSVAFIPIDEFASLRGNPGTVSFYFLKVEPDARPEQVARRVEAEVEEITGQTREEFSRQERKVIRDMSTDILAIMNLVGLLIGLAVMALTVYTSTHARRAEFGLLKALGASQGQLYRAVLGQAAISVVLGFGLALTLTLGLTALAPRLSTNMAMEIDPASLAKVAAMAAVNAGASALLPIRQIAGLDPASVFRRR